MMLSGVAISVSFVLDLDLRPAGRASLGSAFPRPVLIDLSDPVPGELNVHRSGEYRSRREAELGESSSMTSVGRKRNSAGSCRCGWCAIRSAGASAALSTTIRASRMAGLWTEWSFSRSAKIHVVRSTARLADASVGDRV